MKFDSLINIYAPADFDSPDIFITLLIAMNYLIREHSILMTELIERASEFKYKPISLGPNKVHFRVEILDDMLKRISEGKK